MIERLQSPNLVAETAARQGRKQRTRKILRQYWVLYVFIAPALVATFLFQYLPMFSNVIAFMDYRLTAGWMGLGSEFVGFKHFIFIFNDSYFWDLLWRTLFYSVVIIVAGYPAPIILALLLNEVRHNAYKRTVQTLSYLPRFVSWVTLASLVYIFATTDVTGIINNVRQMINPAAERIVYMRYAGNFPWVLAISHVYNSAGWGSIIYLAAISGIDPQLYDAAKIDGANRWQQVVHITLPSILPTMVILFIFQIGGLFSTNFDQVFNLQNEIIRSSTNTINVYTYWLGIHRQQYAVATAVGVFNGLINCIALLTANYLSKRVTSYGLF